jgi:hypothetical protein
MRLVRALLFVALTGSWALADEVKPADPKPEVTKKKVPYRVVKTLPETGQVLLFDKVQGNHVVAELGEDLDYGFTIDEIDDDEVTLLSENGTQVILAAPPPPRQPKRAVKKPAPPVEHAQTGAAPTGTTPTDGAQSVEPVDPYGPVANGEGVQVGDAAPTSGGTTSAENAPIDPYGVSEGPVGAGDGGVRVASAAPAPDARSESPAPTPTPTPVHVSPSAGLPDRPGRTVSAAPIIDAGPPAPADPYGHPGIAAFAEAVGGSPEQAAAPEPLPTKPAKATKGSKKTKKKAAAATGDDASALAALATGTSPASTATTTGAPTLAGAAAGSTTLARGELDAALADFGKLAATFRATFTGDGLRFDTISDGTLLTKIGLRRGDVITHIDGRPLRSLDDAANLYARASSVKASTIQVARDGKLVTLRVAIQ